MAKALDISILRNQPRRVVDEKLIAEIISARNELESKEEKQQKDKIKTEKRQQKDIKKTTKKQIASTVSFSNNPNWVSYQVMGGFKKKLLKYIIESSKELHITADICEKFGKQQEYINTVLRRLEKDGYIKINSSYKYKEIKINPSFANP